MAVSTKLVHSCDIRRDGVLQDAYGGVRYVPSLHLTGVPCRLTDKGDKLGLLLVGDVDVMVGDSVTNLVTEGEPDPRVFIVKEVATRRRKSSVSHKSVTLAVSELPEG